LKSTGIAGRPEEYFWSGDRQAWNRRLGASTDRELVARAIEVGTTPNGVCGVKVMWGYFDEFLRLLRESTSPAPANALELLQRWFPSPRFVWIRREDVVAQAVSFAKAVQTGVWYAEHTASDPAPARYDAGEIHALLREIEEHDACWRRWFERERADVHEVRYEHLEADMRGVTEDVLRFLGLGAGGLAIEPQTKLQRDQTNAEWAARYRAAGGAIGR
jgi:LPS sulfotransferase NodH